MSLYISDLLFVFGNLLLILTNLFLLFLELSLQLGNTPVALLHLFAQTFEFISRFALWSTAHANAPTHA